jgi:hypothetical protein
VVAPFVPLDELSDQLFNAEVPLELRTPEGESRSTKGVLTVPRPANLAGMLAAILLRGGTKATVAVGTEVWAEPRIPAAQ